MAVPTDIILNIVEHMDTTTRKSFMATNKGLSTLIQSYERSISKARAAIFTLPPPGNVLSSFEPERQVLLENTFSMVTELELRDRRIERLINKCPKIFNTAAPPWLPSLTPQQQARLVLILKRALCQCDRIADIAANEPCTAIPEKYYDLIQFGVYASSPMNEELSEFDPFSNLNARPRQTEYIQSLPLKEIAGLFLLTSMLGYGLSSARANYDSDPALYERMTVFEECALRHGTWFVWGRTLGCPYMREMAAHMVSAGMVEVTEWETGNPRVLPGLKMTLMGRFKELVGGHTGHKDKYDKIANAVKKLVLVDDKERTGWESDPEDEE
ncbi:hypothetical protein HD806DRAFT_518971 [Xylariaceae sp. AK1471]|nr:hypothetical protein HD806DRAFT_518971 [Xylariaceae sp. AK1471]